MHTRRGSNNKLKAEKRVKLIVNTTTLDVMAMDYTHSFMINMQAHIRVHNVLLCHVIGSYEGLRVPLLRR